MVICLRVCLGSFLPDPCVVPGSIQLHDSLDLFLSGYSSITHGVNPDCTVMGCCKREENAGDGIALPGYVVHVGSLEMGIV